MSTLVKKVTIGNIRDPNQVGLEKDPFRPGAYVITLRLDCEPTCVWQTLFQQVVWPSLESWDRKVLIVGRELKLVTTPSQVAEKLQWIEELITATNVKVDEYNARVTAAEDSKDSKLMDDASIRNDIARWHLRRVRCP